MKKERKRIKAFGGKILANRVDGELALTRTFGDFIYKEHGVSCHPDVKRIKVTKDLAYVIIASDGIWDSLSN